MVLHNPNNWHWVNRDASLWAKDYLENKLVGLVAEEDGATVKISKVLSMDGDVDVSQRKGKVITIFDVKLQLEFEGKNKEEEDVSGTVSIPEVAHDTAEDEYVFEIELYNDAPSKQIVKDMVRTKLTPQLRKHLCTLGPALISEHGRYIQHAPGEAPWSGTSTPKYQPNRSSTPQQADDPASKSTSTSTSNPYGARDASVNVTTVTDQTEFRTSAAELYTTFTDPQRIAAFTRAPPKVFEGAKVGAKFELFGGNVSGEYVDLEEPTRIIQKWRLKQWPEGHYSKLTLRFDQNDVDAVTVMRVNWEGVPVGQEEVTKRNWGEYYVRSIKTTFGFGTIL